MYGWISKVFTRRLAHRSRTRVRLYRAACVMALIVLTLNSIALRQVRAQNRVLDTTAQINAARPTSDMSDDSCSSMSPSLVCHSFRSTGASSPTSVECDTTAGNVAAAPCEHAKYAQASAAKTADQFNLPDLGKGKSTTVSSSKSDDKGNLFAPLLQQLPQVGQLASSGQNVTDLVTGYVTSRANQYATGSLQQWLSQYGTASISMNVDNHGHLNEGSSNLLLPLYDNKHSTLIFTQLGYQRWDGRNTINLGLGTRRFDNHSMYGVNAFFDDDLTGHNERLGLGFEYGVDYLRLAANGYLGITGWHQSLDDPDYDERPANGFDVQAQMYLPSYPQLGAKIKYERYFGNGVDLLGTGDRQKNPFAVTAGLDYTPVPAVTIGAAYSKGSRGISDLAVNLQLNYRLGVPLSEQFDSHRVAATRTLAGGRYDLVQRNNRIVLDYRKRIFIRLSLNSSLSGYAGQTVPLPVNVTSTYGLQSIQWDSPQLFAHGGAISGANGSYTLTFPAYQAGSANTYTVNGVAIDRQGNVSSPAQMQVVVQSPAQNVSADQSITRIEPDRIYADGSSTSTLTITVLDANGNGVPGLAQDFDLQSSFAGSGIADPSGANHAQKVGALPGPTIGSISAPGNDGVYIATITAGGEPGTLTVTPYLKSEKTKLKPATLNLVTSNSTVNAQLTSVTVTTAGPQPADGQATYTITAHVVDANSGQALPNFPLVGLLWSVNPSPAGVQNAGWLNLTPGSSTTDASGNVTATLSSKIGSTAFTVSAQLGSAAPQAARPVTFSVVARVASLTILAPSSGTTELTTLQDGLNTPVQVHAPLSFFTASAQDGFEFIARVVDARGVALANQSLTALGFQWRMSRGLDSANDLYWDASSTDGFGQAIAYFGSKMQIQSTGPFSLAAQIGSQPEVGPSTLPRFVAFSDIPPDTQMVKYTNSTSTASGTRVVPQASATAFVKDVTYLSFDPQTFDAAAGDTFVSGFSSAPNVIALGSTGLMNVLQPGTSTITETFAHNGYRFTRSVKVTANTVLVVPYVNGDPLQITSPAASLTGINTCGSAGALYGIPGIADVEKADVTALSGLVDVNILYQMGFWGRNPPPNKRLFYRDPTGSSSGWASWLVPGGRQMPDDRNDGTLVCKL